ncbi:MAG: hypothetical protein K0S44_611 [Bacteroidetes bacterium]|jgi:hypothetical protein|nr:hypothetical protein [Bacteroidota bacterium]
MKKQQKLLLLLFCLLSLQNFSQEWKWFTMATDPGTQNIAGKIESDDAGNNFSIGYFYGVLTVSPTISLSSAGGSDIYIIKRDTDGVPLWAKRFGGTADDRGNGITLDHSGNIIFTGSFNQSISIGSTTLNSNGGYDVLIAKLDNSGNPIWAKSFGGNSISVWEAGNDVTCDTLNNIYVTGFSYAAITLSPGITLSASGIQSDMFVLKMNSSGSYQWARNGRTPNGGNDNDAGITIELAEDQNSVVIGGYFIADEFIFGTDTLLNLNDGGYDSYIISLSTSTGAKNFIRLISGAGHTHIEQLALDPSGNIYVLGSCGTNYFESPNTLTVNTGRYDIFLFKYNSAGTFIWSTGMGNSSWGHSPNAITISNGNKIFVAGSYRNFCQSGTFSVNGQGMFLAVLDTNKTTLSMVKATTSLGINIQCQGMAIDAADNVYFHGNVPTGTCTFGATDYPANDWEIFNAKYSFIPCATAPAQPSAISGPVSMCYGTYGHVYSITPVPGTTSYTWTFPSGFSGVSTSNNITVTAGSTSGNVTVKANNGCGSSAVQVLPVTVITPPPPPASITGLTIVCSGNSYTYSVATVSGATSYAWNFPGGWIGSSTTNSINVTAGISGTVYARTSNSCGLSSAASKAVTVNPRPAQPGTMTGNINICQGTVNTYSVPAVSGATSYTWTLPSGWSGTSTSTSITTTAGATSGTISVTANNSCGPGTARTITVNATPIPASPTSISGNNAICPNATNTFSVPTVPGASSYTWTLPGGWSGSSVSNSITSTANLNGGIISVTANNTCGSSSAQSLSLTINNVSASSVSNPTCYGYCSGTATVTPTGTGPFTYSWLPGTETGQTADSLCSGTYTVTITGDGGCSTTATTMITELSSFTVSETHSNPSCYGMCNGAITITPVGGTPPYSYSGTTTNICAGTYISNITDSNGCIASSAITITEPAEILANTVISGISCNGLCDGSATVSPTGGTGPYSYQWCTGTTSSFMNGFCGGTCSVSITDANGCQLIESIIINQPTVISLNTTSGASAICEGDCASLLASVSGGTGPYTYGWMPALNLNNASISNPMACISSSTTYSVSVSDGNGCNVNGTVSVIVNPKPSVNYTQSPAIACENISSLALSPGTPSGGYYSGTAVTGNIFSPSAAGSGSYPVSYIYSDANGCSDTAISTITVSVCTGIESVTENKISVYPNPTRNILIVKSSELITGINIYNILGEEILYTIVGRNNANIDMSSFAEGIYWIRIQTNKESLTKKIVKE